MENDVKNTAYKAYDVLKGFRHAFRGIDLIIRNERNFRIQVIIAIAIVVLGLILRISYQDWISVSILIALVLIAEAFNSAVEALCDTVTCEFRVNIRYAKDVTAGAVLVSSITSTIAGFLIFAPYVLRIIESYIGHAIL